MKINKFTGLIVSLWLALSLVGAPMDVIAEAGNIDNIANTTPEQVDLAETSQTAIIDNSINVDTTSGGVDIESNTDTGSIETGGASSIATVITTDNLANFSYAESFSALPAANTNGDITLDISTNQNIVEPILIPLNNIQETINTTITISSISGDANADENTQIAQISTGDAYSNANLINILGSNVSSPEIFLGYVTVDGNLTGDILLPKNLLQSINSPSSSSILMPNTNTTSTYSVDNNTDAKSTTGKILATSNGSIGSVLSGDAKNMLNSIDLVGVNAYGEAGLLVFVNVTGTWDGSILSQSQGVSAALIGTSSSSTSDFILPLDYFKANIALNNLVDISANSGNIKANSNTTVGDVHTGDATTVVNIANILGSNLVFTKRFGILFITILGNWYGSFGFDTPYGNPPAPSIEPELRTSPITISSPIRSGFVSKGHPDQGLDESDIETYTEVYSDLNNQKLSGLSPKITNTNNSLLDYMVWGVPLIGGGIALSLVKSEKKNTERTKK